MKIPLKVLQNPIEIPLRSMKIHGISMNFIHIKSTENSSFCLVPMMCRVPSSRSPPASRQGVLRRRPSSCGPDTSAACPASPRGRLGQELSRPPMFLFLRSNTHRIHGAAFSMVCHGSHRYTPVMLAYIPAPWILWDINLGFTIWLWLTVRHRKSTHAIKNGAYHLFRLGPFPMAMLVITRPGIRFIY